MVDEELARKGRGSAEAADNVDRLVACYSIPLTINCISFNIGTDTLLCLTVCATNTGALAIGSTVAIDTVHASASVDKADGSCDRGCCNSEASHPFCCCCS